MKNRCIIISAGDLNLTELQIRQEDYVIAVDGGMLYCQVLGIEPDLYLGDFDSLEEPQREVLQTLERGQPERVVRLPGMKDDTDTLAALRYGLQKGFEEFYIYAGLGGRLEHTIANLQCLLFLKRQGAKGYLMDADCMIFLMQDETVSFRRELSGYLSLFAVGGTAEHVDIAGMKYELKDATVTDAFPIGIDNEFIGREACISVKGGTALIIVRWAD